MGANFTINYKETPDYASLIKEFTNGKGVDVIQDPVLGGTNFKQNLDSLAMDSRWVIYGSMGGLKPADNASLIKPLLKRSSILFSTLKSRSNSYKAKLVTEMF